MNIFNGDDDVTDLQYLEQLRHARAASAPSAEATPDCLDDETIAALADGTLESVARAGALPHLAGCSRCRMAVASVARALADPDVARSIAAVPHSSPRRFYRIALPLAAAAAIALLFAKPRTPPEDVLTHRAPTITAEAAPSPESPVGRVAEAKTLRWTAVSGADRYRVTLFDAEGQVRYETDLAATVTVLPDSIVLVPGRPYFWKVEARTGFDRWSASELIEFTVAGRSQR